MAAGSQRLARIRLWRSVPALLAIPGAGSLAGLVVVAAAAFGGPVLAGWPGIALAAGGFGLLLTSVTLGASRVTLRLDVEVAGLRIHGLGFDRRYALVPGPVSRVTLRGRRSVPFRMEGGALSWGLASARLRGSERIDILHLGLPDTAILIPTDRGRLAVSPMSESTLLEALTAAVQLQRRLGQVVGDARARVSPPPPPAPAPPRQLTGIERRLLEERQRSEATQADGWAPAEPDMAVAEAPVAAPTLLPVPPSETVVAITTSAQVVLVGRRRRPAPPTIVPAFGAGWLSGGRLAVVFGPLTAAAFAWLAAASAGLTERPSTGDPLGLALLLGGPLTALAAFVAFSSWPRLAGLASVSAAFGMLLVLRAALG